MSIQFENYPISDISTNQGKIKEIYFENSLVYSSGPKEEFLFTINSGIDKNYFLVVDNVNRISDFTPDDDFSVKIDWGDGIQEDFIGNYTNDTAYVKQHTYSEANKNYNISIVPNKYSNNGWLLGLKLSAILSNIPPYDIISSDNNTKLISIDSPITHNMVTRNGLFKYVGYELAKSAYNLRDISKISLPAPKGSDIFEDYCFNSTFSECTSLINADNIILPNTLSKEALNHYCVNMFYHCENLISVKNMKLPNVEFTGLGPLDFMRGLFSSCVNLNINVREFFGNCVVEFYYKRRHNFSNAFRGVKILDNVDTTIPIIDRNKFADISIGRYHNNCFVDCPADKIINCPAWWL